MKPYSEWANEDYPPDFTPSDRALVRRVLPFTVTSPERIVALRRAVQHLNQHQVPGAFVECGAYKGGSAIAAMIASAEPPATQREYWLYDTFTGMTPPTTVDVNFAGVPALVDMTENGNDMTCSRQEVEANIANTLTPDERRLALPCQFIVGRVEETIPSWMPNEIALLRLDTDWYESTLHELVYLFPRLVSGGIVLIDDYGHWNGARKAVDEYWEVHRLRLPLFRLDYTGRIGVKP